MMSHPRQWSLCPWAAGASLAALLFCLPASTDDLPAFPGAEGFGSTTDGGRWGTVIAVTNLDPDGPGSLREALETEGPRIIIFRVGGTILIDTPLRIRDPFVTVAGQTAPGDGICIRGAHLTVGTHDVIVRGLRFFIGDAAEGVEGDNRDGLEVASSTEPPYNVVLDHCSVSWAVDENLSTWYECHDITVQWCITSEALYDSIHSKGPHSMGFLIGDSAYRVSVHHNLFAHNNQRNPLLKADVIADVVNNVVYNWGEAATSHSNYEETDLPILANHVANFYIEGVDSTASEISFPSNMPPGSEIHVQGNIGPNRPDDSMEECALCNRTGEWLMETPHDFAPVTTWTAAEARDLVLEHAGATVPSRSSVDERVVLSVIEETGSIIDSQDEVGGWPSCEGGEPPLDSDGDGIPDDWEESAGLDPDDPSDAGEAAASGYMWIEEYINSLIPVPGGDEPGPDETPEPVDASTDAEAPAELPDDGADPAPGDPADVPAADGADPAPDAGEEGGGGESGCGCVMAA
jgi:pectate lyase